MKRALSNIDKKYIFTALTILWSCFIFSFSLQPGAASGQLSSGVMTWLLKHVLPFVSIDEMSPEQINTFGFIIRKCAHFTEFFVLGVLMYLSGKDTKGIHKRSTALFSCVLVAVMDESIQLFVDGRAGLVSDVLLDSCGAFVGIMMINMSALLKK